MKRFQYILLLVALMLFCTACTEDPPFAVGIELTTGTEATTTPPAQTTEAPTTTEAPQTEEPQTEEPIITWYVPEFEEIVDTNWQSDSGYAIDLLEDSVLDDQAGEAIFYDVNEYSIYTEMYTGTWYLEDGKLHFYMVPGVWDTTIIECCVPVWKLDELLCLGRNEDGSALPYFSADMTEDVLYQTFG